MRSFLLLAVVISTVLLSACRKEGRLCCAPPSGTPSLTGVWQLIATQASNGSVSGFIPNKGSVKYLIFHYDGRLTQTGDIHMLGYDRYQVLSDNEILFIRLFNNDSVTNYFQVSDNILTVSMKGAIEPQGVRFQRMSK